MQHKVRKIQIEIMKFAAICDDSRAWLDRASEVLEKYMKTHGMDMQVFCYNDTEKCIEELQEAAGVLFMDIEWEIDGSITAEGIEPAASITPKGIEAAAKINERYPNCRIVYLTNHLGYALDVYNTEHAWYVLKEQFEERLPEVFEKIGKLEEESRQDIVLRTDDGRVIRILCSEICYAERSGRKTKIVTDEDELVIREKISELEKMLPASGFARCHNSILLNLAKVKEIYRGHLALADGTALLISRGRSKSFRAEYMNYTKDRSL